MAGCNCEFDLAASEQAFDAIALLVERPAMLDLHAPIRSTENDGPVLSFRYVYPYGVSIVAPVGTRHNRFALGQIDLEAKFPDKRAN